MSYLRILYSTVMVDVCIIDIVHWCVHLCKRYNKCTEAKHAVCTPVEPNVGYWQNQRVGLWWVIAVNPQSTYVHTWWYHFNVPLGALDNSTRIFFQSATSTSSVDADKAVEEVRSFPTSKPAYTNTRGEILRYPAITSRTCNNRVLPLDSPNKEKGGRNKFKLQSRLLTRTKKCNSFVCPEAIQASQR